MVEQMTSRSINYGSFKELRPILSDARMLERRCNFFAESPEINPEVKESLLSFADSIRSTVTEQLRTFGTLGFMSLPLPENEEASERITENVSSLLSQSYEIEGEHVLSDDPRVTRLTARHTIFPELWLLTESSSGFTHIRRYLVGTNHLPANIFPQE